MNEIKVLIIEDNPGDALLISEILKEQKNFEYHLHFADTLARGLDLLKARTYDVVLLDLKLPDEEGLKTFSKVHAAAPTTPVVILSNLDDETTAVRTVRAGAQDYLRKDVMDQGEMLCRALHYAMERKGAVLNL